MYGCEPDRSKRSLGSFCEDFFLIKKFIFELWLAQEVAMSHQRAVRSRMLASYLMPAGILYKPCECHYPCPLLAKMHESKDNRDPVLRNYGA